MRSRRRPVPGPLVQLYTRPGCHLCEAVHADLVRRERTGELRLSVIDISGDPELEARYGASIPVLEHAGRALAKGRFEIAEALRRLSRRTEARP